MDDVLQVSNVFVNVSKGEVAKTDDLQKAFGKTKVQEIVKEVAYSHLALSAEFMSSNQILNKGEVQVGEKEREHDLTSLRREIATLVAEKSVDPATQRPYPVGIIEKAMSEAGYSLKQNKNAKSQVSECIKILQTESKLPIQRARMRVKVSIPVADQERLKVKLLEGAEKVEHDTTAKDDWEVVRNCAESFALASNGHFRPCSLIQADFVSSTTCCKRNAKEPEDWKR